MFRISLSLLFFVAVVSVANAKDPQSTAKTETESITFAMSVPARYGDEISTVGEDTLGILLGQVEGATGVLTFASDSPELDGVAVADTQWLALSVNPMYVINRGETVAARVYVLGDMPPENSIILADGITDLHVAWIKENGSSQAYVQEELDGRTVGAFFIITAEVQVPH